MIYSGTIRRHERGAEGGDGGATRQGGTHATTIRHDHVLISHDHGRCMRSRKMHAISVHSGFGQSNGFSATQELRADRCMRHTPRQARPGARQTADFHSTSACVRPASRAAPDPVTKLCKPREWGSPGSSKISLAEMQARATTARSASESLNVPLRQGNAPVPERPRMLRLAPAPNGPNVMCV